MFQSPSVQLRVITMRNIRLKSYLATLYCKVAPAEGYSLEIAKKLQPISGCNIYTLSCGLKSAITFMAECGQGWVLSDLDVSPFCSVAMPILPKQSGAGSGVTKS